MHTALNLAAGKVALVPGPNNASVDWFKITAGDAYNIVAQKAELEGTIRSFTPGVREKTKLLLSDMSKQTAQLFGGDVEVEYIDFASPLINDQTSTEEVQKTAVRLFGEDNKIYFHGAKEGHKIDAIKNYDKASL